MRTKALLLFVALPLTGCPEPSAPAALPPAGLAGGAAVGGGVAPGAGSAAPHVPFGSQGQPAVAHGVAQENPHAAAPSEAPRTAPHPPMNTVPAPHGATGDASAPAAPVVIPGGGAANVENAADVSGVVAEAHHVREYTYIRVKDANGTDHWAAVLKDEGIGVGTRVSIGKDIWMTDFQSPSMGRTFDRILFGRLLSKQQP